MKVIFYPNRIEVLLTDEEIDRLAKKDANSTVQMRDFSASDTRVLTIARDPKQIPIADKFKMAEKDRKAVWELTRENYKKNRGLQDESSSEAKSLEDEP